MLDKITRITLIALLWMIIFLALTACAQLHELIDTSCDTAQQIVAQQCEDKTNVR